MAREESDREDLLREATALVERIEFAAAPEATGAIAGAAQGLQLLGLGNENIVAGFRKQGALSVFFGAEPVYQFNTAGQLRRAYAAGLLLKAEGGRLVALERARQRDEVQLVRHTLSEDEQLVFVAAMHFRLRQLLTQLNTGRLTVVDRVPAEADVQCRLVAWLGEHELVSIAQRPNVEA
jgi:hypothetical protein